MEIKKQRWTPWSVLQKVCQILLPDPRTGEVKNHVFLIEEKRIELLEEMEKGGGRLCSWDEYIEVSRRDKNRSLITIMLIGFKPESYIRSLSKQEYEKAFGNIAPQYVEEGEINVWD